MSAVKNEPPMTPPPTPAGHDKPKPVRVQRVKSKRHPHVVITVIADHKVTSAAATPIMPTRKIAEIAKEVEQVAKK